MNFGLFPIEVIFQAQILTMCIDNRHLVYVTPHVVLNIVHFMIVHPTPFFFKAGDITSLSLLV